VLQPVLEDLSDRDRRILQLRFVEGWTQTDIGADIGVSQMQVSRLLRQILDDLRRRLGITVAAA
jgi:RNA polymerase sigma-B factor